MCALKSLPLEHTMSSGMHKSMVLAATAGRLRRPARLHRSHKPVVWFSDWVIAATCLATSGGIGFWARPQAPHPV